MNRNELREALIEVLDAGGMIDPDPRSWTADALLAGPVGDLLAERDQALADLAEVKESFVLLRDELAKTRGERDDLVTAAIRQKGRANKAIIDRDQALATLKAVRGYADEREAYGRRGRTVHSARIASDLRRILDAADGGDRS